MNWPLLKKCVDYALELSDKGAMPVFRMATNGMLNSSQIEYITKNFRTISLSLDGPEEIQNTNRRLPDGSGSFTHVYRTAQQLIAKKFPFGIKAVVTSTNFDNLRERVNFFQHHLPGVSVGFEPVNEFGRCKESGVKTPVADTFISSMVELLQNKDLTAFSYSGVLGAHHIRLSFAEP